ncbi:hypothetical protein FCULG_00011466 [Fusarium culmorum]|uniref:Uncharacterized protein n=1 Tax=Fusarium culmorum TaxID=5516 RepID=A0A2T4H4Y6_FUSCU|nr:hypothetical protein FCULG_00011466 [Fusarium culmorum]
MSSSSILCLSLLPLLLRLLLFFFFFSFPSSSRLLSAAMTHAIQPPHPSVSSSSLSNGACFPMSSPSQGETLPRPEPRARPRLPTPATPNPPTATLSRTRQGGGGGIFFFFSNWYFCSCLCLCPCSYCYYYVYCYSFSIVSLLFRASSLLCIIVQCCCIRIEMMWPDKRQRVRLTACRHNDGLTPAQASVIFGIVQPFASKQSSGFNFPVRFVWQLGTKHLDLSTLPVSPKLDADTEY